MDGLDATVAARLKEQFETLVLEGQDYLLLSMSLRNSGWWTGKTWQESLCWIGYFIAKMSQTSHARLMLQVMSWLQ